MSMDNISPHVWTHRRGFGSAVQPCHLICHLWCLSHPFSEGIWVIKPAEIFLGCWRKFFFYLMSQMSYVEAKVGGACAGVEEGPAACEYDGDCLFQSGTSVQLSCGALLPCGLHTSFLYICSFYFCMTVWIFFFRNFHWTLTLMRVFFFPFFLLYLFDAHSLYFKSWWKFDVDWK